MNRKNLFVALGLLVVVSLLASGAFAFFNDKETSTGNMYTAGTLDLKVNGGDVNVKQTFNNMVPVHSQPRGTWTLLNDGSTSGILSIVDLSTKSDENGCLEPEKESGDTTCDASEGNGELNTVLNIALFTDLDCDGWVDAGDVTLYSGQANAIGSTYPVATLAAHQQSCVSYVINWWDTDDDNLAQSDNMTLDLAFNLKGN